MPRFDKTGPRGLGPKTGRGLGNCTVPKGEAYEPDVQVKKVKQNTVADTPEKIIKNII